MKHISIEQPDRSHLEDSEPLRWDRTCSAPRWSEALEHLLLHFEEQENRKRARKADDRERLIKTLSAAILDLYALAKASPSQWLAISLRNETSWAERNYAPPGSTSRAAKTAVDILRHSNLVDYRRGSYNRTWSTGYRTRIQGTPALIRFLEDDFGITADSLGYADWTPLVRLKAAPECRGAPKLPQAYRDTPETKAMRANLQSLNAFISSSQVSTEISTGVIPAGRLYRVFNNGRFDHGGRFYGGWWINEAKAVRSTILIDGETTTELDYGGMHPRLCYHLQGEDLSPAIDPYTVADFVDEKLRELVKKAFNQLLNISDGREPKEPEGASEILPEGVHYSDLIGLLEEHLAPISGWFRKGRSVELQRIDSDIAEAVLLRMMEAGVCCLPIHDSFVVPSSKADQLRVVMEEEYASKLASITGVEALPVITPPPS